MVIPVMIMVRDADDVRRGEANLVGLGCWTSGIKTPGDLGHGEGSQRAFIHLYSRSRYLQEV